MLKKPWRVAPKVQAVAIGAALAAAAGLAASPAQATTLYSTGFEGPDYATGTLAGQNGWFGASDGVVQTSIVKDGSQAVSFSTDARGQHVTYVPINYDSAGNTEKIVTISTDFRFEALVPINGWEGLATIGDGGFITQVLVNASGRACNFNPCNGPFLNPGTWYNLALELNYATSSVRTFVDGVEFSSGPFNIFPGQSTTLSAVGIGINTTFADGNATASWDNLLVTSRATVPEPAAWAMMITGFGMVGLVRRRRAPHVA